MRARFSARRCCCSGSTTSWGPHGFLAMRRTQQEMDRLRSDVQRLNRENSEMSGEAKSLKTDPQAIERIAREEMGLARPGEMIFKLPPPARRATQSDGADDEPALICLLPL